MDDPLYEEMAEFTQKLAKVVKQAKKNADMARPKHLGISIALINTISEYAQLCSMQSELEKLRSNIEAKFKDGKKDKPKRKPK